MRRKWRFQTSMLHSYVWSLLQLSLDTFCFLRVLSSISRYLMSLSLENNSSLCYWLTDSRSLMVIWNLQLASRQVLVALSFCFSASISAERVEITSGDLSGLSVPALTSVWLPNPRIEVFEKEEVVRFGSPSAIPDNSAFKMLFSSRRVLFQPLNLSFSIVSAFISRLSRPIFLWFRLFIELLDIEFSLLMASAISILLRECSILLRLVMDRWFLRAPTWGCGTGAI